MESIVYGRDNIKHIANTLRKNVQGGIGITVVNHATFRTYPFTYVQR